MIDELELHPNYQQRELAAFCRERNIQLIAYSPIARGAYVDNPQLLAIASRYRQEHGAGCSPLAYAEGHHSDSEVQS